MGRKEMIERMTQAATRTGGPIFQQPLLELCGEHRVLIEHHRGVGEYSAEAVSVNVRFGIIRICGTNLEICRMSAEQLVVIGNINAVEIQRGGQI